MSSSSSLPVGAAAFVGGACLLLLQRYRMHTRFPPNCRIVQLFIYPVKALQGIKVESVQALERGFKHDRRFMIVDTEGNFVTQREIPSMATIQCEIVNDDTLKLINQVRSYSNQLVTLDPLTTAR